MEKGKKRLALLVGCNYPNSQYELHGCINDVVAMRDTLVGRFGFDPSHIELLTDKPGSSVMPTGENIKRALGEMVDKAEAGDVLYFHYSGHGTRIPSVKPANPFGRDEAIVPCDFNLITDVDFRNLVNRLPKGASFTILSDSCHSGGLIDKEKEQIGPASFSDDTKAFTPPSSKPKTIPFDSILQHFTSLTNINTSDVATHSLELFGTNSSLKFRLPRTVQLDFPDFLRPRGEGILLSGCQANETSADMNPAADGGKAFGAFSNAVETVLKENPGRVLSNREVVMMSRKVLKAQGFDQHPCLYCSDENADVAFLWQPQSTS
ncbi:Caspase-like domain containing protein [Trema orientale]|uniref:Caspase-like domain containing protein n=1 Tax=Trema orientale TaxID=63057 RepID=A0A2P5EW48_TREOI|nr:Caspase-like domain containing protein [Trema orientale]